MVSNFKQIYIALSYLNTNESSPSNDDEHLYTMEELIWALTQAGVTDSTLFISTTDLAYIEDGPIPDVGYQTESGTVELNPKFLRLPIGFSYAVYAESEGVSGQAPLFWTRGLHKFKEFNAPYSGYIAFSAGNIEYFKGSPNEPNAELERVFGEESGFTKALQILEHEPSGWAEGRNLAPLPVRFATATKVSRLQRWSPLLFLIAPAMLAGIISFVLPKPAVSRRLVSAIKTSIVVLIATLLISTILC